jgi:hypothetical protein
MWGENLRVRVRDSKNWMGSSDLSRRWVPASCGSSDLQGRKIPLGGGGSGASKYSHSYRILWKSIGKNSLQNATTGNKGKLLDNFAADFCFAELSEFCESIRSQSMVMRHGLSHCFASLRTLSCSTMFELHCKSATSDQAWAQRASWEGPWVVGDSTVSS